MGCCGESGGRGGPGKKLPDLAASGPYRGLIAVRRSAVRRDECSVVDAGCKSRTPTHIPIRGPVKSNDATDLPDRADLSYMGDDGCPNATGDTHLHDLKQLRAELQRGKAPETRPQGR